MPHGSNGCDESTGLIQRDARGEGITEYMRGRKGVTDFHAARGATGMVARALQVVQLEAVIVFEGLQDAQQLVSADAPNR